MPRYKLTAPLESRDGTIVKGARMKNMLAEVKGNMIQARKRPGLISDALSNTPSSPNYVQGAFVANVSASWTGGSEQRQYFICNNEFSYGKPNVAFSALPGVYGTTADRFHFAAIDLSGGDDGVFFKNNTDAYYFLPTTSTLTRISDIDYPCIFTLNVTSITRVGSVATVTTSTPHNFRVGLLVQISGAVQPEYNLGGVVQSVPSSTTFTYNVTGTPTTPATGTITTTGGILAAPGCVALDGYIFVMDENGTIYNSDLENPLSWNSLNFIACESVTDGGKGIARYQNYIVGFGSRSMEFFYDAANSVGSPLSRVENAAQSVGCYDGNTIAQVGSGLAWVGIGSDGGVGVYALMSGFAPTKISTPDVDRVIDGGSRLPTTYSGFGVNISGHDLYLLVLDDPSSSNFYSLVFDMTSQIWYLWSRSQLQTITPTSVTQTNGVAVVTHSIISDSVFKDGDSVTISGASPAGYNKTANITKINSTSFSYPVDESLSSPATGTITVTNNTYTEAPFLTNFFLLGSKKYGFQHNNYDLYEISESTYQDDGAPIDCSTRTTINDGDSAKRKFVGSAEVIGDKVSSSALLRYSDDDYTTYSPYRAVDLSAERSRIHRLGSYSRRSYEIRHTENTAFVVEALETQEG